MASALVLILADTFRLRSRNRYQKKVKSLSHENKNKAVDGISQSRNDTNRIITSFAFRFPSSTNWLYLSISRNGKSSKLNFGFSSAEPIHHFHIC